MRILITTFTYAPQANGVAEVVGVHAEGFARRGHEVTVATAFDARRTSLAGSANPRVVEFKVCTGRDPGRPFGEELERYQSFLRHSSVDVILCHCWQSWNTDAAISVLPGHPARKIMVSHGFSAHRWVPRARPWFGLGQWFRARSYVRSLPRMLSVFDHVVFLSPRIDRERFYDRWTLKQRGGAAWSVIPNGTWPEKFAEGSSDFRARHSLGGRFMALCVALYAPGKHQEGALRAFLSANLENSVLVFIGNEFNDYSARLQRLHRAWSRRFPKGRVLFLERQDKPSIYAAYRAADVFVMSSKAETQPLVLLDAMACGKPFISTDVGCVADLPGGRVVADEAGMTARLREFHGDEARRTALGHEGRLAVQSTFHWEKVLDAYEQLLHSQVAAAAGTSGRTQRNQSVFGQSG